jgi:hypothetical protein
MSSSKLRLFFHFGIFLMMINRGISQDRLYTIFQGNESSFNPSLAGFRGAFTLSGRFVSQWQSARLNGFQTGLFKLEESLPCSIFDYDLHAEYNKEGTGIYQSVRVGGNFAGTAPIESGNAIHNLRIGVGLVWQFNAINFGNLIFSDQLNPKYGPYDSFGNLNPGSFVMPVNNRTNWFFTPSIGLSHRILFNSENKKSSTLLYGVAIHHLIGLSTDKKWGQAESILGLETILPYRVHGFLNLELIPYYKAGQFLSIKPQLNFEIQGALHYWNVGTTCSLNRNLSLGTFLQQVSAVGPQNTRWISLQVGLGNTLLQDKKVDLNFSYNIPLTGIKNFLGPFLEAGIAFHFSKSPGCGLLGRDNALAYPGVQCPSSSFSRGRRKLYENIW